MINEKIGQVDENEKNEIQRLYERIIALNEVAMTLDNESLKLEEKNALRDKIETELPKTQKKFDEWWSQKAIKYGWKNIKGGSWSIDFQTNEVSLRY